MRIAVISAWHNEAVLAPFFLGHYSWADRIHLIIGDDTTDGTLAICARYRNVWIDQFTFPSRLLNDTLKIKKFNALSQTYAHEDEFNWIIAVDADEFIFAPHGEPPRDCLARQAGNLLYAEMWQVYRHLSESDLDPSRPALGQRQHGNPRVHHIKPIIVRAKVAIEWETGHHGYIKNSRVLPSPNVFCAAHWAMADADLAIARYIAGRRDRMSQENLQKNHGVHTFNLTEESIRAECAAHLEDPLLEQIADGGGR